MRHNKNQMAVALLGCGVVATLVASALTVLSAMRMYAEVNKQKMSGV